jgi:hypothetical protein
MARFPWTRKQNMGPRSRLGHRMAFDSGRRRVVLFGGNSRQPQAFSYTWEWVRYRFVLDNSFNESLIG